MEKFSNDSIIRDRFRNKSHLLYQYQNGGAKISIFNDGTKIREFEDNNVEFAEQVDLKITNFCDLSTTVCRFCHEKSTVNGKHGDLDLALRLWDKMPAGVEIAIGGGNPLSHPNLIDFLTKCKDRGWICNLTVNQMHLDEYENVLEDIERHQLIHGLGVSVRNIRTFPEYFNYYYGNVVLHMILGIDSVEDFISHRHDKVLLLGYKTFGLGEIYKKKHAEIEDRIEDWKRSLPIILNQYGTISFDNLALEQLELKRWIHPDKWAAFYQGDDGTVSFYVDLVNKQYCKSSTSVERFNIEDGDDLISMFNQIRKI